MQKILAFVYLASGVICKTKLAVTLFIIIRTALFEETVQWYLKLKRDKMRLDFNPRTLTCE